MAAIGNAGRRRYTSTMERFEVPITGETERLVEAVERGDEVVLTRDGKAVVKLQSTELDRAPSPDVEALLKLRESLKELRVPDAGQLVRDLRDAADR